MNYYSDSFFFCKILIFLLSSLFVSSSFIFIFYFFICNKFILADVLMFKYFLLKLRDFLILINSQFLFLKLRLSKNLKKDIGPGGSTKIKALYIEEVIISWSSCFAHCLPLL